MLFRFLREIKAPNRQKTKKTNKKKKNMTNLAFSFGVLNQIQVMSTEMAGKVGGISDFYTT